MDEYRSVHGDAIIDLKNLAGKASKEQNPDSPLDIEQREKVREAMIHAWAAYEKYAWGQDELQVCGHFLIFWRSGCVIAMIAH